MNQKNTLFLLVILSVLATSILSGQQIVTFYNFTDVNTSGSHSATFSTSAHSDAIVIIGTAWEGVGAATSNVQFDSVALGSPIGSDFESANFYLSWGSVGNISSGNSTVTFDAADQDVALGVWVLEGFIETPSASQFFGYGDGAGASGGEAGTFAFNDTSNLPSAASLEAGATAFDFDSGDYVFSLNYNGNESGNFNGLIGALQNDRKTVEDVGGGSYGAQFADGIASADSQAAGWDSTADWFRVGNAAVAFSPIPEPSASVLLIAALGLGFLLRRRR